MALTTRRRISSEFTSNGIIHHSDAGSQYTAIAFSEELEKEEMLGSIGTVGDALDNALMESTIGLYKTELIGERAAGRNWSGMREVERETAAWGLIEVEGAAPSRWLTPFADVVCSETVPGGAGGRGCGNRTRRVWCL